jgi:sulfhydrogenase subunit beta (sulfur reductase)
MSRFIILPKAKLAEWVDWLIGEYRVFAPRQHEGSHVFSAVQNAGEVDLSYAQTLLPPKKCIIPQRELLYSYDIGGMRLKANVQALPTVIFGVHTCDQHAIRLFDRIFSHSFTDQHYKLQREKTFVVGLECLSPCTEQSFCRSMGTTSPATDVFDLHMIDLGNDYCIEVGTAGGAAMTAFSGFFAASDADLERRNHVLQQKWVRFPYRLNCDVTDLPPLLGSAHESPHWQELGDQCLACGMCTQVCPTCYCFNIEDKVNLKLTEGQRFRSWDSCQVNDFAMVAGGHNFREKRAARQRHRFMRKGKYQYDANDMVGCVGCGRCATACLVQIAPIKTFNELWRLKAEQDRKAEQKSSSEVQP